MTSSNRDVGPAIRSFQQGIPSLPFEGQRGLPREGDLLNTASPRTSQSNNINGCNNGVNIKFDIENIIQKIKDIGSEYVIQKGNIMGVDVGASSVGVAWVNDEAVSGCTVRLFNTDSRSYAGESKHRRRRRLQSARRGLRRRRNRLSAVRRLLLSAGFPDPRMSPPGIDPYRVRAEGLDRRLSAMELSVVLYGLGKRRGMPSMVVKKRVAEPDEPTVAPENWGCPIGLDWRRRQYRTVGEMFAVDGFWSVRKRNKDGLFHGAIAQHHYRREAAQLIEAQRSFGFPEMTLEFEIQYLHLTFETANSQGFQHLVGSCPYLPTIPRAARRSPSVERFLLLDALSKIKVWDEGRVRRLSSTELSVLMRDFGAANGMTRANIRQTLQWPDTVQFPHGVDLERDLVVAGGATAGTAALVRTLGDSARRFLRYCPEILDDVATILTFRHTESAIAHGLRNYGMRLDLVLCIRAAYRAGELTMFKGTAAISAVAAAKISPFLAQGKLMFDAAQAAGFDPRAPDHVLLQNIRNPIVSRALRESLLQIKVMVEQRGVRPERIHIETADELGASRIQRDRRAALHQADRVRRDDARIVLAGLVGAANVTEAKIVRYQLWQSQEGICLYSGRSMSVRQLIDGVSVQVDHIWPRSRSGDNSLDNCVVCFAEQNQEKGELTPYEWLGNDKSRWQDFVERVGRLPLSVAKKRRLLTDFFSEREARILTRNLNDTRYASRCLISALRALYPEGGHSSRLVARPGQLTAELRKAWGVSKQANDPRNHGLDAIVVACASHRTMSELARAYRNGAGVAGVELPLPWPTFADDAMAAVANICASRTENRRGRGPLHGMTLHRVRVDADGRPMIFERRPVSELRLPDLARIPDPHVNQPLIQALSRWFEAGQPKHDPPRLPSGDVVRRVRLLSSGYSGRPREGMCVRGGVAAFGEIVRFDLYQKGRRYYIAPVYFDDVANLPLPPDRLIRPTELRRDWDIVDQGYAFHFSIYHGTPVRIVTAKSEEKTGFVRSFDVYRARLILTPFTNVAVSIKVGTRLAQSICKLNVDRLGRTSEIYREPLMWHGRVVRRKIAYDPPAPRVQVPAVAFARSNSGGFRSD